MDSTETFVKFLTHFVEKVEKKSRQLHKAQWLLETTGSLDAADLMAELEIELRLLFNDKSTYQKLLDWDQDNALQDPLLKRQLSILKRKFKENLIPKDLLEKISTKEAALAHSFATFRPTFEGKSFSENELIDLLKKEHDPERRKKVWEATKEIGKIAAPQILELVELRNLAALAIGYPDYFQMQLDLQECDGSALFALLDDLAKKSDNAHKEVLKEVNCSQSKRFKVKEEELGPWAWNEPFCQQDPLDTDELDSLVKDLDLSKAVLDFYKKMGFDIQPTLDRSDMYERKGKNQYAFCTNIDRKKDVRTLNNLKPTIRWLETLLHELGHAVYELGFSEDLPWLLREPPHMITTEAMALLAGRQAYRYRSLKSLLGKNGGNEATLQKGEASLKRRQLIFSRFVLVMTHFERELYQNPTQDLNALWWGLVEKYQKIPRGKRGENSSEWASKVHLSVAPVYYFSYLLGELFASSIEKALEIKTGTKELDSEKIGLFLHQMLFQPGNRFTWNELIEHVSGKPLTAEDWAASFGS